MAKNSAISRSPCQTESVSTERDTRFAENAKADRALLAIFNGLQKLPLQANLLLRRDLSEHWRMLICLIP